MFKNGHVISEITKKRISEGVKLAHQRFDWNKGRHHTEEAKNGVRIGRLKRKELLGYLNSPETRKKLSQNNAHYWLGKKHPEDVCKKRSDGVRKHYDKIGRKTHKRSKHCGGYYKEWRTTIFKRDNFTCLTCEQVGGKLNAHHIKAWTKHPELRFDANNGITVCENCHKIIHKLRI